MRAKCSIGPPKRICVEYLRVVITFKNLAVVVKIARYVNDVMRKEEILVRRFVGICFVIL